MKTSVATSIRSTKPPRARRPAEGDLRAALERLLSPDGWGPRVVEIVSRPFKYASSFAIEEIAVRLDNGCRLDLVCKDTSITAMLPEARRIKPTFLRNPFREIAAYAAILSPLEIDAPLLYGASIDAARDRFWLFLERVNGSPLSENGDFSVWLQASVWLANMHSEVRPERLPAIDGVPLLRYDGPFYRRWMHRAQRFLLGNAAEDRARRLSIRWLADRYDRIVDEVMALPPTFVHGEFYASNILVEQRPEGVRIRPLDWELSGIGYPLMDLAALTAGWTDAEQGELAFSYYAALDPETPGFLSPDSFIRALDCCRVLLAVQCLGWANRWVPPRQHSRDWLREAIVAAERIAV